MDIDSLINAQFNRAVEIVQSLPKTGPIQTGYEEKLAMYSLYKQATQGNVKTSRPGMWDMLGRAKWDEWAKHKDMDTREAQWMYVETLKKVLRKYPDRTIARDLIAELDSYAGDPSNLVMSSHSNVDPSTPMRDRAETSSSGSSRTGGSPSPIHAALREAQQQGFAHMQRPTDTTVFESSEDDTTGSDTDGENDEIPPPPQQFVQAPSNSPPIVRPRSSLSSQRRYRTPVGRSNANFSPARSPNAQQGPMPVVAGVPLTQPQPRYAAPSAFAPLAHQSSALAFSPQPMHPAYHPHPHLHPPPEPTIAPYQNHPMYPTESARSPPRSTSMGLERAIVDIQASLAALRERLESLESGGSHYSSASRRQSPPRRHSPLHPMLPFNLDPRSFGAWSVVLTPLARSLLSARRVMEVIRRNPTLIIIRRLMLDISFLLALVALIRACWKRFGGRRREVLGALSGLWIALVNGGQMPATRERILVDRGI